MDVCKNCLCQQLCHLAYFGLKLFKCCLDVNDVSVIDPCDKESIALRETAEIIRNDVRLFPLLLPLRDGVMIYQKMK